MTREGLKYFLNKPHGWFFLLVSRGLTNWMSDEQFLRTIFRYSLGYPLNPGDPKTFNEKLQWLKLHDRRPIYNTMVDKYAVKRYITDILGDKYVIPVIGGPWQSAEEIDFDSLPERFVLKCNHDSGGLIVCRDKAALDQDSARAKIAKRLRNNYYWSNREWAYKDIPPCVFAEQFMGDGDLYDYKVLCFNGMPKLVEVHKGRFGNHTQDFYDTDWNRLPITQGMPLSEIPDARPVFLDEMLTLSRKLAEGFCHIRIDWFFVDGQLYFGEYTLYDGSGLTAFEPPEWDLRLGSWIKLPCDGENNA